LRGGRPEEGITYGGLGAAANLTRQELVRALISLWREKLEQSGRRRKQAKNFVGSAGVKRTEEGRNLRHCK